MYTGVYSIRANVTVATAITILQVKAGANKSLEVIRAWLSQRGSIVNVQESIQLLRKTAAATVTSFTPLIIRGGAADCVGGTSATGHTGTSEGSDGDVLIEEGFSVLNGWLYLPALEERVPVPAGGIIALKFPNAPATQSWKFGMIVGELG